jgi:hypothetical protein
MPVGSTLGDDDAVLTRARMCVCRKRHPHTLRDRPANHHRGPDRSHDRRPTCDNLSKDYLLAASVMLPRSNTERGY